MASDDRERTETLPGPPPYRTLHERSSVQAAKASVYAFSGRGSSGRLLAGTSSVVTPEGCAKGWMDNLASPNRRRSPGGVAEVHPGVAGRRSRVLMAEHRGQLAKTQNSTRAPSSTTRFGGMLKKSVAALALRAMKLNRRFRHRIIGAGPVGRSRELST